MKRRVRRGRVARPKTTSTPRVPISSCTLLSLELGLPYPLPAGECVTSSFGSREVHYSTHSLAGERVGESQFRRGDRHCCTVGIYMYVLCGIALQRMASDVRSQFVLCMARDTVSREEQAFCSRWNLLTYPHPPPPPRHPNVCKASICLTERRQTKSE